MASVRTKNKSMALGAVLMMLAVGMTAMVASDESSAGVGTSTSNLDGVSTPYLMGNFSEYNGLYVSVSDKCEVELYVGTGKTLTAQYYYNGSLYTSLQWATTTSGVLSALGLSYNSSTGYLSGTIDSIPGFANEKGETKRVFRISDDNKTLNILPMMAGSDKGNPLKGEIGPLDHFTRFQYADGEDVITILDPEITGIKNGIGTSGFTYSSTTVNGVYFDKKNGTITGRYCTYNCLMF